MRAFFLSIAALTILHNVDTARVLGLFPHTGRSHQMVFEPLLRVLAERGHQVTVVSFFPLKNPPANYTDVSLVGISELGIETIDLLEWYENNDGFLKSTGLDKIIQKFSEFYPLDTMAQEICSGLVKWAPLENTLKQKYDVVLTENFNSDCMLGLLHVHGVNAPVIALSSTGLMPWLPERFGLSYNPSYTPVLSYPKRSPMSLLERIENTLLQLYYRLWYRYAIQVKEQAIIEKHFNRKIVDLDSLARNITMILVHGFHTLNGVRQLLPGVVEVGGMHLNRSEKVIPNYIEKFLNESEHGVILLSFGSLIKTSTIPKYKEEIIIRVLSKFKQRVIWKYEDSDEEGTLVGNILKVRWIPQYELLKHKKVLAFIGHGGLLGMTEAVSVGKPMVVVPFYGDQPTNAAAAASIGFAKKISYADINDDTLFEAVQSVLSAEMRLSARLVSKMWHDRQSKPLDTAVYWVERVIRWGHKDPLHSPARDLNFIQLSLLDVGAALAVILIVLVLILKAILLLILRVIKVSFNVNVKEKKH